MNTVKPIIEIKSIGKKYNITHQKGGYVMFRDVLASIAKRPFAFLKHKAKQVVGFQTKEEFWALRDVSFNVMQGEIVGIIGANGAGKSTLLKILTGITPPTEGEIIMRGRVASLLEVGTGFHPELTGRENIFLNGAILGMTKKEIVRKFDEIVAFSGVEKFLDTPVKHYSSGMYVRLAFSVAAHMEPDILIVDEVLAVGDAEFQKKCLGKMEEVTQKDGRTILFVSHNLDAIQQLCKRTILLEHGQVKMIGETNSVVEYYLNTGKELRSFYEYTIDNTQPAHIQRISIFSKEGVLSSQIPISEDFFIKIEYSFTEEIRSAVLSALFYSENELLLLSSESDTIGKLSDYEKGRYETIIKIPAYLFNIGYHRFDIALHHPYVEYLDNKTNLNFEITDVNNIKSRIFQGHSAGKIATILDYKTNKI